MKTESGEQHRDFFFIQMADVQFGLFEALSGLDDAAIERYRQRRLIVRPGPKISGFADETALYEKAIAAANRLSPEFVVMCGDMVQDSGNPDQIAELMRITGKLQAGIPMKWVAGNHDVGNDLTAESLQLYHDRFGPSNYYFEHMGSRFVVLDTNVAFDPTKVPDEWDHLLDFLRAALGEAVEIRSRHILVFTHYPLFIADPDEEDSHLVIPRGRRRILLELLKAHGATGVFSGHWHRNNYARDGELLVVASAAVGYPLGYDASGFRVVKVLSDRVEHEYYGLDEVPSSVDL